MTDETPGDRPVVRGPADAGVPTGARSAAADTGRDRGWTSSVGRSVLMRVTGNRQLLLLLATREIRTRYRQSILNLLWSIITPVVVLIVYGLILTNAFDVDGAGVPYLAMAWTGLALWGFFSSGVGSATQSILSQSDLVSKVYFPRETLPLATVGAALLDLGVGMVVLACLVIVLGVGLSIHAVAIVPVVLVLVVFTGAASVFLAVIAVFVRDTPHAVALALRVGFFATPVVYPPSVLPSALRWLSWANPVAVCIDAGRASLLYHHWPDWPLLGAHAALAVGLAAAAVIYTARMESRVVDEL